MNHSSILDFFSPIDLAQISNGDTYYDSQLGDTLVKYVTEKTSINFDVVKVAIIGVEDARNSKSNEGASHAPDAVRKYLYKLQDHYLDGRVADLGNIKAGNTLQDTLVALKMVCFELIKQNIIPMIIGGGHFLTYAQYEAYQNLDNEVEVAVVDAFFDMDDPDSVEGLLNHTNHLNHLLLHEPNYLYNLCVLGYQTHFAPTQLLSDMDKMLLEGVRLGELSGNIMNAEPYLRNADMVSIDMTAVRATDAAANAFATPNGLYGEQLCQLSRYAGNSDKLTSFGIYEFNPLLDDRGFTAHLVAQMIWYFLDGWVARRNDIPMEEGINHTKYHALLENHDIVFVKSNLSDKWWMRVPYPAASEGEGQPYKLVACSYADYQQACNQEMPDRWWRTYQRLF